jgi:hypothetical protein
MSTCSNCSIKIVNGIILGSRRLCQGCFILEVEGTEYGRMLAADFPPDGMKVEFPEGMEELLHISTTSPNGVHPNDPGAIQCKLYDVDGTGMTLHDLPAIFPASSAERMYTLWHENGIPLEYLRVNNPIASLKLCDWCGRKAKNKCTGCKRQKGYQRARYCDKTCQKADRSRHEDRCNESQKKQKQKGNGK